jgi:hypothetical protein
MVNECAEACKRNFEMTGVLLSYRVCPECNGCVMASIYKDTKGAHPSTVFIDHQTKV